MPEKWVKIQGVRLWTTVSGTGIPVMLCNGGAGMADYLASVSSMIEDQAQVMRFEQRGCGRSDAVEPYTIATCLTDLDAIRRYYGIEAWIIGGHSFGADLALLYALEYPQHTRGLICLAGGRVHDDRQWHAVYEQRQAVEGEIVPETAYPFNPEVNKQINQSWKQRIHHPDLLKQIAELRVPALFLYGAEDIRPSWPVEQVAHLLPHARFVLLEKSPHVLWAAQPERVRHELRHFLAQFCD